MNRTEHIDSPEALGAALRQIRKARHLTQARAAALCGVSPRLWSETESGKRSQLGFATALRMLHVLGLDLLVTAREGGFERESRSR